MQWPTPASAGEAALDVCACAARIKHVMQATFSDRRIMIDELRTFRDAFNGGQRTSQKSQIRYYGETPKQELAT